MSFLIYFLIYILLCYLYTKWDCDYLIRYYRPLYYQKDKNSPKIDVHSLYPEFALKDKLNFPRLLIGNIFLAPIKLSLEILCAIFCILMMKYYSLTLKNPTTNPEERKKVAWVEYISCYIAFYIIHGLRVHEKKLPYEEIYKKYLGQDYDFSQKDYSLIICNHIGFFEVAINMIKYQCGFIAKKAIKNYYFIGQIATQIGCLFVDRENNEERKKIFEELEKRQRDYYTKKNLCPLVLFPEGTTTTGKHILKYKKGAFYSLLPIKPEIINIYHSDDYHVSIGAANVVMSSLRSLAYFNINMYFVDLPVINPTDYMFEKYKSLGKEKWEIFAEVTRRIICEVGGFEMSDKNFRDQKKYVKAMITGNYYEGDEDIKEDDLKM